MDVGSGEWTRLGVGWSGQQARRAAGCYQLVHVRLVRLTVVHEFSVHSVQCTVASSVVCAPIERADSCWANTGKRVSMGQSVRLDSRDLLGPSSGQGKSCLFVTGLSAVTRW